MMDLHFDLPRRPGDEALYVLIWDRLDEGCGRLRARGHGPD